MALALGGAEAAAQLWQLLSGGEIGEGNVQLGVFHIHIDPDKPSFLRQGQAGLNGVVKEVADDAAQVNFRGLELHGDMGVGYHLNALGLCQGDLGIQNGVRHGVAGFDNGVHGGQILIKKVQVVPDGFPVALGGVGLHNLDVVPVVMPPAPNLLIHIVHFPVVGLDQFLLVGLQLPVHTFGKESHFAYLIAMIARLTAS